MHIDAPEWDWLKNPDRNDIAYAHVARRQGLVIGFRA